MLGSRDGLKATSVNGYFEILPEERQTYPLTFFQSLIITLYEYLMQLR